MDMGHGRQSDTLRQHIGMTGRHACVLARRVLGLRVRPNVRTTGRRTRIGMPGRRRAAGLALFFFVLSCSFGVSWAQEMEHDVKAAFVYNFIRYAEWPARAFQGPDDAIVLWVAGTDDTAEATAALDGRTVKGRKIVVKRINGPVVPGEKCHLLFVGKSERSHVRAILGAVRGMPVLTIADFPGFARSGGVVNFVLAQQKVAFEINQVAAERGGLRLSSQLLKLARIVQEWESW
jgi:hypothetical protein